MQADTGSVPVFILCGGLGTRLADGSDLRPKPMVPIGNRPILWHVMRSYAQFGFRRFVLCTGFQSDSIKSYFLNYHWMNSDFSIDLKRNTTTVHGSHDEDWEVTLAYTGEVTMTGARVARAAARYLGDAEHFAVTYGDGLTDANLLDEYRFHLGHQKVGTVLGVHPPSRFGEFKLEGDQVSEFEEKPEFEDRWINGGYFFFRRDFKAYLSEDDDCILERAPLGRLARDGELRTFRHDGFWACMDTPRDRDELNKRWATGDTPWLGCEP